MNEEEIKAKLTPEEYKVLREGGTEAPFSGKYYEENKDGIYTCKVCNNPLFTSEAKYHSDIAGLAGWPSFDNAIPGATEQREDYSAGLHRTEIICAKCKSHLGHIFPDVEAKTGQHFCINSVCLDLKEKERKAKGFPLCFPLPTLILYLPEFRFIILTTEDFDSLIR